MSLSTSIQWCDATVNFWWGCAKVSTGCRLCYAERMAKFLSHGRATWGPEGLRWLRVGEACQELLKLEARAIKTGRRLRVFVNSMADTFEDRRDLDRARELIFLAAACVPHLDLLVLTKRPENVRRLTPELVGGPDHWPANVWLGFTAEDQAHFNMRWPILEALKRRMPGMRVFCSAEPLLGPVRPWFADAPAALDWLILGGESGGVKQVRPLDLDHLRASIRRARQLGIPVFVKQLGRLPVEMTKPFIRKLDLADSHGGDMAEWPEDLRVREVPDQTVSPRITRIDTDKVYPPPAAPKATRGSTVALHPPLAGKAHPCSSVPSVVKK
ncbi:MAG: DUF5131 family protein [Verrucomicrobia bacterium]|nr:DUF5131 family protein [Verrucomicrobiota bacterium]